MKDCLPGFIWDNLLWNCIKNEGEPEPVTVPSEPPHTLKAPLSFTVRSSPTGTVEALGPALWIVVVLSTLGSALALALWFVIYRRQRGRSSTAEDVELQQKPLEKLQPSTIMPSTHAESESPAEESQAAAGALSACSHLHPGAQAGPQWEESSATCRDPAKHAGTEVGRGLPACNTMWEHRIPLPATELGGTALVTTKTM